MLVVKKLVLTDSVAADAEFGIRNSGFGIRDSEFGIRESGIGTKE